MYDFLCSECGSQGKKKFLELIYRQPISPGDFTHWHWYLICPNPDCQHEQYEFSELTIMGFMLENIQSEADGD